MSSAVHPAVANGATVATGGAGAHRVLMVGDFSASKLGNASVAEQLARKLAAEGDSVVTTSDRTNRLARVSGMVLDTLARGRSVDVAIVDVHADMGFRWAEWTTAVLKAYRTPVIHVLRGGSLPTFAVTEARRVERLFAASSSIVALSGFLQQAMSRYGDVRTIIPNPIEVSDYPYRPRERARPRLVWLRTFNSRYNPTLAPRVLAELRATRPVGATEPLHLTMYGADQHDGSLHATHATARELGVQDMLSVPGSVAKTEVPARLAEGDIFLNTTNVDNTPISVIEAMACGLCVVSTDVGGMPYIVTDGVDGLLVPPDDPVAMAAAVRRVLDDPALAHKLSVNARRRAESFDWGVVLPRWRQHVADVAAGRVAG